MNEKEIQFIIGRFENANSGCSEEEEKENSKLKNSIMGLYSTLHRKKRRELSTIIESQLIKKMQTERNGNLGDLRRFINEDTMRMIEKENSKIKATKQELIYKEASRKIHQICADNIHGRRLKNKKSSRNTLQMEKEFTAMLNDSLSFNKVEENIKNQEEKELYSIVKAIRMEKYNNSETSKSRNPLTVMACLVGWRKAKKLLEQE